MTPRRVLVTGGHGFLGRHLVRTLQERGDRVVVVDASPPPPDGPDVETVVADVRDIDILTRAARGTDVVLHMAAVVGVDNYLRSPTDVLGVNVDGTRAVLEAASVSGARLILASTSEIYGRNPAVPWAETDDRVLGPTTTARWSYSTSKAFGEHMVLAHAEAGHVDARVVRYFNVYGPGQRPAFLVSRSVHRALRGRPLLAYDGGTQTRCFTYVDDAVDATLRVACAEDRSGSVFNIGNPVEWTVADALRLVAKSVGSVDGPEPGIAELDTASVAGARYQDLDRRVPDVSKIARDLGWRARIDLESGLRTTVAWARAAPWWLALPEGGMG